MKKQATHFQVETTTTSSPRGSGMTVVLKHGRGERSFGELLRHFEFPKDEKAAMAYRASLLRVAEILNQAAVVEALTEADNALDYAQSEMTCDYDRKRILDARKVVQDALRLF